MKHNSDLIAIKILLMIVALTHRVNATTCELNSDFCDDKLEITSTSDYMELEHKLIENVASDTVSQKYVRYPESLIEHNGFVYFSNLSGLFIQQENSPIARKINGFPEFTQILLDKNSNRLYFGTKQGLSVVTCGKTKSNKIHATDGFAVDFGVIDGNGDIYFGNYGDNMESGDNMFVLRKKNQRLIRIGGIEPPTKGSYTLESMASSNKIAVDSKNNVYIGGFTSYIYQIEPNQCTAKKIKDIKSNGGVAAVGIDSKDNVFFRTNHGLYTLKSGEKELIKIFELPDDFNYFLAIDANDDVYFQFTSKIYVLKPEPVTAIEIDITSSSNGPSTGTFTEVQNFQVKNKVLYFTSTYRGNATIFALKPTETSLTEIHTTANSITSLAIDNSDNVFFITFWNDLAKYVPFVLRKNSNTPIEIHVTGHLSHVFADNRNNIYFGSGNGLHVLHEDEVTPFKIRTTESQVSSFVVDRGDNVYFGTDYDGAFVLRSGAMEADRISGINTKFGRYVEVFGDRKYDVIYVKTGGALFKLNGGETVVKTLIEGYSPDLYLSNLANDIYYVQPNDGNSSIMSVKSNDTMATNVIDIEGEVLHISSDRLNNLFFVSDKDELHILKPDESKSRVVVRDQKFSSLNVDGDNNVYYTTKDVGVFVLTANDVRPTKVRNINGNVIKYVESGDDVLFVTRKNDNEQGLFLIRNKLQLETIFKNRNLGMVENSEDETIFNLLNYLNFKDNYLLNKNKDRIINKTPTSATVLATNGKFRGGFNVTYSVKSKNDENVGNFDLTKLLEKAVFFDHVKKNRYNFRNKKDTRNITVFTENLKFLPVEVTQESEPISSVEFKNICFNKKRVSNTSPLAQTIKIPECRYETKETILFQITTGLNKSHVRVDEPTAPVLKSDDENLILNSVGDRNSDNTETSVTLSGTFDLSNLKEHSHDNGLQNFQDDEQDIIIPAKQRILVNYSVRSLILETQLNLRQKIRGTLIARIKHAESDENVQITLKEAMQTLKNNNILPDEISINTDNSVTFNGKAKLIVKRESEPKIIRNFYDI